MPAKSGLRRESFGTEGICTFVRASYVRFVVNFVTVVIVRLEFGGPLVVVVVTHILV